ncbi:hypothetical protein [Gilvimarinus sp. DA14]|uniref:hypothetical protein n=1 Tax=Gilvimarinus sp. DA14 TaxID=2956798 RepID=UPI0020B74F9E|nr:hypothetical protein [Gilvimarinus sp. DA14]UTF58679.1 hypothetical protein NHM04_09315 [Gilvimarinus sp. DA14]
MKHILLLAMLLLWGSASASEEMTVYELIESDEYFSKFEGSCPTEYISARDVEARNVVEYCKSNEQECFNKCKSKDPSYCYSLAKIYQSKGDDGVASSLFAASCIQGVVSGCTNRAAAMNQFEPERTDCYIETFKLTCARSDAWGCTMYGFIFATGEGAEVDVAKAKKYLELGCMNGVEDKACRSAKALSAILESQGKE